METMESGKSDGEVREKMPRTVKDLIADFNESLADSDTEVDIKKEARDSQEDDGASDAEIKTPPKKRGRKNQNDNDTSVTDTTGKKKCYKQKYIKDWEKIPAFKPWLTESLLGSTYFYCKFCKADNKCGRTELEKHMSSRKHMRNATQPTVKVQRKFTFRGLLCPVFTPFNTAGDINYEIISSYANYLAQCGVKGILVNDVVGEGMSLTTTERMHITEIWIKECEKHGMMLMVHVGGAPMKDVKEMAKHAERKKAGAIVVLPDVYNGPENHYDLMRYLKTVSNVANTTPLLYHHFPKQTRVDIDMTRFLFDMIGEIDSFVGIIYSSNDFKEAASALAVNEDKYTVFMGTDEFILGSTALGFNSIMSASLNFVPKFVQSIRTSVKDGNIHSAKVTQKYLTEICDAVMQQGQRVPSLKCAMNILSPVQVGVCREPLVNIWEDKVNKLKRDLENMMKSNATFSATE